MPDGKRGGGMSARRLARGALLTAIALTIFMVEAQIPPIAPVPGMKLGLANIVTVYAMFALGPADTLMILLARVILGSLFAGGSTFLYSLAGGLLCYCAMLVLRRALTLKQLWVCGAIGAIFHNVGQMIVAVWVAKTVQLALYLPLLMVTGILAGAFTGLAAQFLLERIGDRVK